MKSNKFFRKALSVMMAAVVSATTVFPVYASDIDSGSPVTETDDNQDEAAASEGELATENVSTEAEQNQETDSLEATKEDTGDFEVNDIYALCLPKLDNVSYNYDKDHLYSELSDSSMDVLVYEEGEHVNVEVSADCGFAVVDGYSEEVFLSEEEIKDGKLSFDMPATDLMIQFKGAEEKKPVNTEILPEETEDATEVETEVQTETTETELPETETELLETETELVPVETETQVSEEQTETEQETAEESETEDMSETEIPDTADVTKYLYPEAGSTVTAAIQNIYYQDADFDYKSYIPDADGVADADITWEKGDLDFGKAGSYDVVYKAVLKTDSSYYWYIDVPMELILQKEAATATSDGFAGKIFLNKEQAPEYTGKIPEKIGEHVTGPDVETVKGENFSLKDVNLGYDMDMFSYSVYDDGGFQSDKPGTYKVVYLVESWADSELEFYVDCNVTVKESIDAEDAMTVHIINTELKATVTDTDGNVSEAAYGADVASSKNLKEIVVKSAWKSVTDISPSVTVLKNGKEVSKDGIISSESKDGNEYVVTLDSSLEADNDKYVFVVDWPNFDPTDGGRIVKDDRRSSDYVNPVEEEEEAEFEAEFGEEGIMTLASSTTSKSKTWNGKSNASSCSDWKSSVTNYGWQSQFTGYSKCRLNFSSSFKKNLEAWVNSIGADFTGKVPSYVDIKCSTGNGTKMGWNSWSCASSLKIKATVKFKNGTPYKLTLSVTAPGKQQTSQGNYQTFVGSRSVSLTDNGGNLQIVKTSYGKFTAQFEGVKLLTSFGIYNDPNCTDLEQVIQVAPDDEGSSVATETIEGLDAGTYYVQEIGTADGHMANRTVYPVTVEGSKTATVTIPNTPYVFTGTFVHKVAKNTYAPLPGAVFEVNGTYSGRNLGKWYFVTDNDGNINYDAAHYLASWNGNPSDALVMYDDNTYGLPETTVLNVKEVQAPDKYVVDNNWHSTNLKIQSEDNQQLTCDVIQIEDEPDEGKLQLWKQDSKLGASVPNKEFYSLAGAKYSVKNKDGVEVAVLTTNEEGKTEEVTLPTGEYTVTEAESPFGYQLSPNAENVTVTLNQTNVVTVKDEPETGSLDIHKKLDPKEKDAIKELRDLTKIEFILSYKTSDGKTVYATDANGSPVLHPDANGDLHVDGLYYGTWTLSERQSTDYHQPMDPVEIEISSDDTDSVDYEVENYRYESQLTVLKKDVDTGTTVLRAGATFKIKDEVGEYVSLTVSGEKTDTFVTDDKGLIAFDEKIPAGKYTLVETIPPKGYNLADPVEFEVSGTESSAVVEMRDKRVTTKISIEKKDASSSNSAGKGFTFNVIADEDAVDTAGNVYEGFKAGSVVDTIVTDESGIAKSAVELYPGRYHIEEASPADNYLNDAEKVSFEVVEKEVDGKWIAEVPGFDGKIISVKDTPVMRPIKIQKTDSLSGNAAGSDFTFTITADKVVDGSGAERTGFEHGTVVDTITTDGRGIATSKDLYCGTYIVKETVRKQNYVLSTKEYEVEVTDENKTNDPVLVKVADDPLKKKISVTKIDKVTGNHCGAGFKFQITVVDDIVDGAGSVYDGYKAGSVVDTITTDENGIATSKELLMGNYIIQEIEVSEDGGMAINETKYPFTLTDEKDAEGNLTDVKDTDETIVLPINDIADNPTTMNIKKIDSLQDKDGNSIVGEDGQPVEGSEPKVLEGITFRVKEKDAADSDDQLHVTDKDGNIKVEYLKKNTTYTIQETATIPGYNLNDEVYEFTVDEKGLINGESSYSVTITNQPNEVHISKVDITNSKEISGAKMKLTDMDGNVLDEWTSEEKAHVIYGLADGQYRLVESVAPDKYEVATSVTQGTKDESEKENIEGLNSEGIFTVKDSKIVQQVTMKDSPYRWVELSKKEITGDDELPGCTLTVRDDHGDVVDTWVSTTEAHKLQLHSGVYTLTEEKPADGYVTADTVKFEVKQTSETDYDIQKVTMRDEVTKITISKKDITTGEELPGAHLVIKNEKGDIVEEWTSTNETHYVEKLPIGKYTLTEITAPDKYEVSETISFEIKDTGEIQHYEMFDSPYRPVEISKKDITNNEELPGANLEIRDADNNVVDSWTSTSESHKVDLPHGKYTLIETKPADGYTTAESINFEVLERNTKEENGVEIQHVEMEDDVTKVQISKQDVTTKKELPGAKLQIKDKNGNIIEEWTSTNEVHYIEKLPIGEYTLIETTAPNGYDVAESVQFKVLDTNEIQHVIMYDSPTVTPGTNAPKTGDINPVIPIAAVIIVVILAGTGIFLVKGRKKKTK